MATAPPTAFISYAWEEDAHRAWVRRLAERLRRDGVETVLDQWETAPGDQLAEFMEGAIRNNDFVVIVCTPTYKERSDKRRGGVGYEGGIMTAELYRGKPQRKFIPVKRIGTWDAASPSWLSGKQYVDLSGDPYDEEQYHELVRALHEVRSQPPPVRPVGVSVGTGNSAEVTVQPGSGESEGMTVSVLVGHDGGPVEDAEVLALFPNKTCKQGRTNKAGEAQLDLHTDRLPLTVFVGAPSFAASVVQGWTPADRTLAIELEALPGGGSVVFARRTGYLAGLEGRLNPILDSRGRSYLYATNIAIDGGKPQPVHFTPGEGELHLMDVNSQEYIVRVVAMVGDSSLLEYRPT